MARALNIQPTFLTISGSTRTSTSRNLQMLRMQIASGLRTTVKVLKGWYL